MLNGLDPIFLFNFFKVTPQIEAALSGVPVVQKFVTRFGLPPIPLYLKESLTGLYVDNESKNIDIETALETPKSASDDIGENQKGVGSTVSINLIGNKDSIGIALISALADVILKKVTEKSYSITYLHGATTVFNGLLHQFEVSQNANDTRINIQIVLSNSKGKPSLLPGVPQVPFTHGSLPL